MNIYLEQARPFSLWLARQLDHNRLNLDWLNARLSRSITPQDYADFADWQHFQETENEEELAKQLRVLRRHVMAHIMTRDLNRLSDLAEVTRTITEFADFAVNTALLFAYQYYQDLYGTPMGHYSQENQFLSVVAMGKAGGFELNVSSDIDLIFIFQESGTTNGKRERTNQEFFTKVGQKLIALLNDITADGFVFRVDMRLRPDGDSGALVLSETALEQYLITQGREWERYAWCKGRVVTPYANDIAALVRPFVFRKYLDYNAYSGMRDLHRQIRQEVQKRGMADNVKLGAGGIREIEFIAQIFQLIRGGRLRALQLKGTQETLNQLAEYDILPSEIVDKLLNAYRFLRDVEHRLQYWDDQQTQMLPASASEQSILLAKSIGFEQETDFLDYLNKHRVFVNEIFNEILNEPESEVQENPIFQQFWQHLDEDSDFFAWEQTHFVEREILLQRLRQLKNSSKYRQLSSHAQTRFDAVLPRVLEVAQATRKPDATVVRLLDFLENISRRSAYLVFLQQYPKALKQLAELMSQSAWLAQYLHRHPILLDELLSAQLMERLNWSQLKQELSQTLNACEDTESKMDALRHFQHAQIFRLAVQDLAGLWTVEALSDELSLLADIILEQTLSHIWRELAKTDSSEPKFAIIGYGKLGGKELSYTSDLDLVYLFEDDADELNLYLKISRRLSTWLSGSTGAGTLYELDLRLRPNGESGFLAHSLTAFEKYQRENAWTWEHQSLTRARFICGDADLGAKFERVRREILTRERNKIQLKQEIISMREKMFVTHPPKDEDVKYARGGVVDVEFMVQYWVLSESRNYPELLENYGNIALLKMVAERGLIDPDLAEQAQQAYRYFRQQQHYQTWRDGEKMAVDGILLAHYQSVRLLWRHVFGQEIG